MRNAARHSATISRCLPAILLGVAWLPNLLAAEPRRGAGKLRIICFGAHPDDAEFKAGGTAAKWARRGIR